MRPDEIRDGCSVFASDSDIGNSDILNATLDKYTLECVESSIDRSIDRQNKAKNPFINRYSLSLKETLALHRTNKNTIHDAVSI